MIATHYTEGDALQVRGGSAADGTAVLLTTSPDPLSGWGWVPTNWLDGLLLLGSILYGMNAGIFFIFSVCIMPSLAATSDETAIAIMQKINDVIQNAWFLAVWGGGFFQGVALLTVLLRGGQRPRNTFVYWKYGLSSALCYIGGCILVTIFANVPRNDALAGMDASSSEAAAYWREEYLTKWVTWNHVRTAFCFVACVLSTMAFRLNSPAPASGGQSDPLGYP